MNTSLLNRIARMGVIGEIPRDLADMIRETAESFVKTPVNVQATPDNGRIDYRTVIGFASRFATDSTLRDLAKAEITLANRNRWLYNR